MANKFDADNLPDDVMQFSFNFLAGSKLQSILPSSAVISAFGRPQGMICIPPPKGRPVHEKLHIAIIGANDGGYYALHMQSEQGHASFGVQYKPDKDALGEYLVTLGFPQKNLKDIGLTDASTAQGEAKEILGKLLRGRGKPAAGGSTPA